MTVLLKHVNAQPTDHIQMEIFALLAIGQIIGARLKDLV